MAGRQLNNARFPWFTVQESLNQHIGKIVRVTPTIVAGTTDNNDVAWNATEIPNAVPVPGGTSRLIAITLFDEDVENHDMDIVFTQNDDYELGTVNAAPDISDVNFERVSPIGVVRVNWSEHTIPIATGQGILTLSGNSLGSTTLAPLPMLLQADVGSTSVYFHGIAREEIAWAATNDLKIAFHIEYR
tara:strand:+ start:48 stop:611 length:564 start_codon:yes stop_codon:yes gene_type:complete